MKILDKRRYRVRKLTPTEYGRLQAFPMEEWEQVVSDTQAYKQFGNAVTTNVAAGVAGSITKFLQEIGIITEGENMENATNETVNTNTSAPENNPAIVQILGIIQPKKERLAEIEKESSQLKTEIDALEVAISTIKNN